MAGTVWETQAQFRKIWLNAGAFGHEYSEVGGKPEAERGGLAWPQWYDYKETHRNDGIWIAAKNVEDETGEVWPVRIAHVGARSSGENEFFPQKFEMISRFDPPTTIVDGLESFKHPLFNDRVDSDIPADRMIHNVVNTLMGVQMDRKVYQFSQDFHDDYHIIEYTFTNTGNVDEDDEIEFPDRTLEELYFYFLHRYHPNEEAAGVARVQGGRGANWGKNTMVDAVGDGHEDYEVDFRAQYVWHGFMPEFEPWNNIGGPALTDQHSRIPPGDSLGRLTAPIMVGRVFIHADERAHAPGETVADDPDQPSTMVAYDTNDPLTSSESAFNLPNMQERYNRLITAGRVYPHHADLVTPPAGPWDRQRLANQTNDPSRGITGGGWGPTEGFGPYTLGPGEEVRIVVADAISGLDRKAAREIGHAYKSLFLEGRGDAPIDYDANNDGQIGADESMSKNEWVMTARDSLFQVFERAIANRESDWGIPRGPKPPREFRVTSGVDRVTLEWEPYTGENPEAWEIYRAAELRTNPYELIATVDGSGSGYEDPDVERGISYFYYLQAVGSENTDGTGMTPSGVPLRSNRAYTQTFDAAFLKRPPGGTLDAARVVPNPYNLGSNPDVRWPDIQDQIAFLGIPGDCTIKIFTELGELVETIEHTDGSGDEFWDLTTSSNQVVVSGIYVAVITDHNTGEEIIRKIIIVR
jgi:hypothetical protein